MIVLRSCDGIAVIIYITKESSSRSEIEPSSSSNNLQGSMVPNGNQMPPNVSAQQQKAREEAQKAASDRAKLRSRKPTDQNLPDGLEEIVHVPELVEQYKRLQALNREIDAIMARKRLDIIDAVNRPGHVPNITLRISISNTVEDQAWQTDMDVDAFDFTSTAAPTFKLKIQGFVIDEPNDWDSDDFEESDLEDEDELVSVTRARRRAELLERREKEKQENRTNLAHYFKQITVEYDRDISNSGEDNSMEWKKPMIAPGTANLPNSADFDCINFKRVGDENINVTIKLYKDTDKFKISDALREIVLDDELNRGEITLRINLYVDQNKLADENDPRKFHCDELLKAVFNADWVWFMQIGDLILPNLSPLPPIELPYTLRFDEAYHAAPDTYPGTKYTIYDVRVEAEDLLKKRYKRFLTNPEHVKAWKLIKEKDAEICILIQALKMSKARWDFFSNIAKDPAGYLTKWLSSQTRDLEVLLGDAQRGGAEDGQSEEFRRGGDDSVWKTESVAQACRMYLASEKRARMMGG